MLRDGHLGSPVTVGVQHANGTGGHETRSVVLKRQDGAKGCTPPHSPFPRPKEAAPEGPAHPFLVSSLADMK